MLRPLLVLLAALGLAACAAPVRRTALDRSGPAASDPLRTARADVDSLAHPRFAGRGYDRRAGADAAAAYVERRFRQIGLAPVAPALRVSFAFDAPVIDRAELSVDGQPLALARAFLPFPSGPPGRATGRVVRVGHGLRLPGLDAYAGRSVTGAMVVLSDTLPALPPGTPEVASSLLARAAWAQQQGAVAAVLPVDSAALVHGAPPFDLPLPVFLVDRKAWPASAQTATFRVDSRPQARHRGVNLVGMVRGTARPDSFVVVTAHYDHLGALATGRAGADSLLVFRGANDNASGVAMLLALAAEVRARPLRHTVVFAALGGEELGLFGAKALAAASPWPLDRTRFLVNLDMAASGGRVAVFGAPQQPDAYGRLERLAAAQGTELVPRGQRPNSDQWPFVQRGVAAFYLVTDGGGQPYHRPDDRPETLDWAAWARLHRLAGAFLGTF